MKRMWTAVPILIVALVLMGASAPNLDSRSVPRMSVEELNERLGENGLVVIDVRSGAYWDRSDVKIPGAVREAPNRIDWAGNYSKQSTVVLYCT